MQNLHLPKKALAVTEDVLQPLCVKASVKVVPLLTFISPWSDKVEARNVSKLSKNGRPGVISVHMDRKPQTVLEMCGSDSEKGWDDN